MGQGSFTTLPAIIAEELDADWAKVTPILPPEWDEKKYGNHGYTGGFQTSAFRTDEEALDALARGEVDAAFAWGPTAGYYNLKKLGGGHRVVPVAGEGLQWRAAVAVRKGRDDLRAGSLNGDALAQACDHVDAWVVPTALVAPDAILEAQQRVPQDRELHARLLDGDRGRRGWILLRGPHLLAMRLKASRANLVIVDGG